MLLMVTLFQAQMLSLAWNNDCLLEGLDVVAVASLVEHCDYLNIFRSISHLRIHVEGWIQTHNKKPGRLRSNCLISHCSQNNQITLHNTLYLLLVVGVDSFSLGHSCHLPFDMMHYRNPSYYSFRYHSSYCIRFLNPFHNPNPHLEQLGIQTQEARYHSNAGVEDAGSMDAPDVALNAFGTCLHLSRRQNLSARGLLRLRLAMYKW